MSDSSYVVDERKKKRDKPSIDILGKIAKKIKKVKHLDIVIAVSVIALILVFSLGAFGGSKTENNNKNVSVSSDYTSIETRVCNVLSQIKGAGQVSVMINFDGSGEIVPATTTNSSLNTTNDKSSTGDRTTESKTDSVSPVIIQQNGEDTPLIVKEISPKVVGVVVVAEGASDVTVRINLLQAVQTLLRVDADKVEIFTMK